MTRAPKKARPEVPTADECRAVMAKIEPSPAAAAVIADAPRTTPVGEVRAIVERVLASVRLASPIDLGDASDLRDLLVAALPPGECAVEVYHRPEPDAEPPANRILPDRRPQVLVSLVLCGPGRSHRIEHVLRTD